MEPNKYRAYVCDYCGHVHAVNTNHKVTVYCTCPSCGWRRPRGYQSHSSSYLAEDMNNIRKTGMARYEGKKSASRMMHLIDAGLDEYHNNIVQSALKMVDKDRNKGYYVYHTQFSSGKCLWVCADENDEILI